MKQYIPIKISNKEYLINLFSNHWMDTGLPVSEVMTMQDMENADWYAFRLYISEMDNLGMRVYSMFLFTDSKKVTVEFMGDIYHPGEGEYELRKLHDRLMSELSLAYLEE